MKSAAKQRASSVMAQLNGLAVGDLQSIQAALESAGSELETIQQLDLAASVRDARQAVDCGDIKNFRRLIAQVVSKLGHVRDRSV